MGKIVVIVIFILIIVGVVFCTKYMLRNSKQFWAKARELEDKINNTNDKEELLSLYDNEWKELKRLQMGEPQTSKLTYLYGLLKGKYEASNVLR